MKMSLEEYHRLHHNGNGRQPKTRATPQPRREIDLTKACCQLLAWAGFGLVERQNTGVAMLTGKGGKPRPVRFGTPGRPDIEAFIPGSKGRKLCVETKVGKGRLSPAQRDYLRQAHTCGACCLVVRDEVELLAAMGYLAKDPNWAPRPTEF